MHVGPEKGAAEHPSRIDEAPQAEPGPNVEAPRGYHAEPQRSGTAAPGDQAEPELTPTGRVILGMIAFGKQTGYDIKQLVDKSTRHFWAASYGQIYPELRRLEAYGLVQGRPEPSGGRARTVYELTDDGHLALRRWLESTDEPVFELRDEGMLRLFFSDLGPPALRIENLRAMRMRQERKLELLRAIESHAKQGPPGAYLTLQLGMTFTQCYIEWCEAAERRLAEEKE
jgi:DNA-binding PadR family transcriptional regulator